MPSVTRLSPVGSCWRDVGDASDFDFDFDFDIGVDFDFDFDSDLDFDLDMDRSVSSLVRPLSSVGFMDGPVNL